MLTLRRPGTVRVLDAELPRNGSKKMKSADSETSGNPFDTELETQSVHAIEFLHDQSDV